MNENLLSQAQLAFARNDLFEASLLYRRYVTYSPDIVAGWLGLFQSIDQHIVRLECLEQLLRITRAENQAVVVQPEMTVGEKMTKVIVGESTSEGKLIKPYANIATVEAETSENWSDEADKPFETIEEEIESGWPRLEMQILRRTTEMVDSGNRLMQHIDTKLVPAITRLKQQVGSHSFFTTQFTTGNGRKLRRLSSSRVERLPKMLSWVWWLVGMVLVGLVAVGVAPVFMGNKALVIISGSMVPAIDIGSVVVVKPVESSQLTIGDVIAYSPNSGAIPIVHRIINIREEAGTRFFTTQGDANTTADSKEVALPPTTWQLWYSVPWLGYVINFSFSRAGFVVLVFVPLIGLGALTLKDRMRQPQKHRLRRAIYK